jgi:FKBP-type peptidyl-prolyl cis-trans isomerase
MPSTNKKRKISQNEDSSAVHELDEHSKLIIEVRKIMRKREKARIEGDFIKSDSYRDLLGKLKVRVVDQVNGPSGWHFLDRSLSTKLSPGVKVPEDAKRKLLKDRPDGEQQKPSNKKSKTESGTAEKDKKKKKKAKSDGSGDNEASGEAARNKATLAAMNSGGSKAKMVQGVSVEDLAVGSGTVATSGKKCSMHYVGRLKSNNKVFDSSQRPFTFKLGRSEVIRGWDIGVAGMRVGGKRRLIIPPEKGYGRQGSPPVIPGNATLLFDVQLLDVKG